MGGSTLDHPLLKTMQLSSYTRLYIDFTSTLPKVVSRSQWKIATIVDLGKLRGEILNKPEKNGNAINCRKNQVD